jgi:hypothetical protein
MALVVEPLCPQCQQRYLKWVMLTDEVVCMKQDCNYQATLKDHNKMARMGREQHDD